MQKLSPLITSIVVSKNDDLYIKKWQFIKCWKLDKEQKSTKTDNHYETSLKIVSKDEFIYVVRKNNLTNKANLVNHRLELILLYLKNNKRRIIILFMFNVISHEKMTLCKSL